MTLLSLFMTSTGIFCFVPISQRLIESGIIPTSDRWRLPAVLAPTFYTQREDESQSLLAEGKLADVWLGVEERHQIQSSLPQTLLYATGGTSATDKQRAMTYCVDDHGDTISSIVRYPANSLLQSTSFDTFYGRESASFVSDSTLCDSCNDLLRRELEIPPDHIPNVVRALALFEAQDRSDDVAFDEREVIALTDAFSMLRL